MASTGFPTTVACRAHQQNNVDFCGMTAVMMVLDALGAPLSEEEIGKSIPGRGPSNAPPDQVAAAIQNLKPAAWHDVTFAFVAPTTQQAANLAIVRTLYDLHAPVATQVLGTSHWLVVVGALTDVEPEPSATFAPQGFFVNNPTPVLNPSPPDPVPMTHTDTDTCGRAQHCGELHEFISMVGWASRFTPTGAGQFVCVPGSGTPPQQADSRALAVLADTVVADTVADMVLDPVTQAVMDAIASFGLATQGPCAKLLQKAVPSGQPQQAGDTWYVTLFAGESPTALAIVALDAGTYTLQSIGVTVPGATAPVLSAASMAAGLRHREFHVAGRQVKLNEGEFDVIGPFWRPCAESPSPYDPLYEIRTGHGHEARYYTTLAAHRLYADMTWYDVPPAR